MTTIHRPAAGWLVTLALLASAAPSGSQAPPASAPTRADRIVAEAQQTAGDVLVFSHGHLLRILAARWLGLEPGAGKLFALDPATVSVLGFEHDTRVIQEWNAGCLV